MSRRQKSYVFKKKICFEHTISYVLNHADKVGDTMDLLGDTMPVRWVDKRAVSTEDRDTVPRHRDGSGNSPHTRPPDCRSPV